MNQNRDKLVEDNLRLVHYILRKNFKVSSEWYDDCFQEGCMGLCLAAERFDESKGLQFATYASSYIMGYIQTFLRNNSLLKVPRPLIDLNAKILKLQEENLSPKEIQERLGIDHKKYSEAISIYSVVSLDTTIDEDEHLTLADTIGEEPEGSVEDLEEIVLSIVNELLKNKSQKIRDVCEEWIYSKMWLGEEPTQAYLGKKYGLSQSYVSRIRTKFDKELKEKLQWQI